MKSPLSPNLTPREVISDAIELVAPARGKSTAGMIADAIVSALVRRLCSMDVGEWKDEAADPRELIGMMTTNGEGELIFETCTSTDTADQPMTFREALHKALHSMAGATERWEKRGEVLSDADLTAAIAEEFGIQGGFGTPGGRANYVGGVKPRFDFTPAGGEPRDCRGAELLSEVRKLLEIEAPWQPAPAPKPERLDLFDFAATNARAQAAEVRA